MFTCFFIMGATLGHKTEYWARSSASNTFKGQECAMLEFSNLKWRTPPKYFLLLDTSKTYAMTSQWNAVQINLGKLLSGALYIQITHARYCTRSIIGADDQVPRLINLGIINSHQMITYFFRTDYSIQHSWYLVSSDCMIARTRIVFLPIARCTLGCLSE